MAMFPATVAQLYNTRLILTGLWVQIPLHMSQLGTRQGNQIGPFSPIKLLFVGSLKK